MVSITFILSSGMSAVEQNPYFNNTGNLISPSISSNTILKHNVTFIEAGLTVGTTWSVTFNGTLNISTTHSNTFLVPNGNYSFNVTNVTGYIATPYTGIISVNGSDVNRTVNFTYIQSAVNLGAAGNFTILAETGITNSGTTAITGNMGVSPGAASTMTGFALVMNSTNQFSTSPYVNGKVYAANYAAPTPAMMTSATGAMTTAYTSAAGKTNPTAINLGAGNLNGLTLVPGLYKWSTAVSLSTTVTLTGNATSVWIFQISGSLTVGASATVVLSGGALPQNIFWQVASGAALGTSSVFSGVILSATDITIADTATLTGRALAQTDVTLIGDTVTAPTNVTVSNYNVTFTETGLLSGTQWNVTMNGKLSSSTTTTNNFTEINGAYAYTVGSVKGYKELPLAGNITVSGANVFQTITFVAKNKTAYNVTFTESGLPVGNEWNVTVNGTTTSSRTTTVVFAEFNGTFTYNVFAGKEYKVSVSTGSLNVVGKSVNVSVTFTAETYNVTFTEIGLTVGTAWNVIMNTNKSSTTNQINFTAFNGTYAFTVISISGYHELPASGYVTVVGLHAYQTITFVATPKVAYNVTFTETGLPSNIQWNVTLNGTTTSSVTSTIVFAEFNGTFAYSVFNNSEFKANPNSGKMTVSGKSVNVSIAYTEVTFNVTFTETGLPSSTAWYVNITGHDSGAITGSTYTVPLLNGTYAYTIGTADKIYNANGGSFTVNGKAVAESVAFAPVTYKVTFTETGLPSSTAWYVNITGQASSGPMTGSTYSVLLSNGTYAYTIGTADKIYNANGGSFTVNGKAVAESVAFAPVTYKVTFTETGLPSSTAWYVNITGQASSGPMTGSTYSVLLSNGTYTYNVTSASGSYTAKGGNFTVSGKPVNVSVTFTSVTSAPSSNNDLYIIAGIVIVAAIIGVAYVVLRKK
ncbi:MAG: ice-binding family protein [Thermoplasmataceae archaeon]